MAPWKIAFLYQSVVSGVHVSLPVFVLQFTIAALFSLQVQAI